MGIVSYACNAVHISRWTYYRWRKTDEEFRKKCDDIREDTVDVVESKLFNAIADGNITAIIFYLKTHAKDRGYVEQVDNNINLNKFEKVMKELPDDPNDDIPSED